MDAGWSNMGYDLFESDIEFSTKSLAIELAKCNDENEVVKKLKNSGYWDDYKFWHAYGDNENNYSTIGNQQSKADAALVDGKRDRYEWARCTSVYQGGSQTVFQRI